MFKTVSQQKLANQRSIVNSYIWDDWGSVSKAVALQFESSVFDSSCDMSVELSVQGKTLNSKLPTN